MIEQAIREAILKRTSEIIEEESKTAATRVERRVREMTAQIAATICKRIRFDVLSDTEMKITVEFDKVKFP